jgi:hypothetical protein
LTIAEQITAAQALIADLKTRRQTAIELGEQAKAERVRVALAAAEGDAAAQAALDHATAGATKATLDIENLDMALGAARERLTGLQAQAQQERLATVRARALELARERQELGHRLQQVLTDLNTVFVAWHDAGHELASLRYEHQSLYLPHNCDQAHPFLAAVPDELRQTFRKLSSWVHPTDRRGIAEADPAAAILRQAGELAPLPPEPPSLAEQVLDELNAEAARLVPRPDPGSDEEIAAQHQGGSLPVGAVVNGNRLVGKLPGGGGVWEPVRPSPPAAA